MTVLHELKNKVEQAMRISSGKELCKQFFSSATACEFLSLLNEDLDALTQRDPAAGGDALHVLHSYTSFAAVLHYRIAHHLLHTPPTDCSLTDAKRAVQRLVYRGKQISGAELHPKASIGRRFVLDHGVGTVVGETAVLGDDCYVLGGVTLGSTGVAGNSTGIRHPVVGSRVQIGAYASLLGRVRIGDDVFIGAHCIVHCDVPAGHSVTVRQQQQVIRTRGNPDESKLAPLFRYEESSRSSSQFLGVQLAHA